ncbi:MAG TPA: hypothetical protein VN259_09790, partial [Xanthomonadales bacterium]|nr:hypothetical protein [Xanthomonadales bacterium]
MTLRLRYYLAILPLFVGLGLINSLLVYYTERDELSWGLQERAQGAAASVVGFWEVIEPGSKDAPAPALKRYSERLGGLSISWFEMEGDAWRQRTLLQTENLPLPPPPPGDAGARLHHAQLAWSFLAQPQADADLNVGYAPLVDADGKLRAVIAVAERDQTLRTATAALKLRLGGLMLALLLAGVAAAELITRIARRELTTLTTAARDAARGHYLSRWPDGHIQELNDLGGTLLTMTSLLADESHQTRRRFFQAEPLPDQAALARGYRQHMLQALPEMVGDTRAAYRQLGEQTPEDFCGWRQTATGWYLCTGRRRRTGDAGNLLQSMVQAESACEFLLGVAVGRPLGPSWPEALKLFPCECLQLI